MLSLALAMAGSALATDKPITLLVGYASGGLADKLSRLAAAELSKEMAHKVVVRNVGGANGLRAAAEALQGSDQTDTLLFADSSLVIAHELARQPAAELLKFEPVATLGSAAFALVVPASSDLHTITDLLTYLGRHPGEANYGTPGAYSIHQLITQGFLQRANTSAQQIPYQGGVQMLADLLSRRLTFGVLSLELAKGLVSAQQLRVLATTGARRSTAWPDVPTLSETYPGLQGVSVAYLLAAPQMEQVVHEKISKAWQKISRTPGVMAQLTALGMDGPALDAPGAARQFRLELGTWKGLLGQQK